MISKEILIYGVVQGVGFRPFVYKLAHKLNLLGFVSNDNNGVIIQVQGDKEKIKIFEKSLIEDIPPLAKISKIEIKDINIHHKGQFEIISSIEHVMHSPFKTASIPVDTKICNDCLLDINSLKLSKYYKYFASNCTNCGPRYSIIQTVPYDRINTSMKNFILCDSCKLDYENPINRRYHAQPTSCKNCGPELSLFINKKLQNINDNDKFIKISQMIKNGKIGAIKGLGGFHIVCDASNDEVIRNLRIFKNRPNKPFAIMCKNLEQIKSLAKVNTKEEELLLSKQAPIVILKKIKNNIISKYVANNINKIGCMLPYTGLHNLLFEYLENPIIATSANLSAESIILNKFDIIKKLPFIDFILDYNRDIVNAIDDSVIQVTNNDIQILRLARGYAPFELNIKKDIRHSTLSIGANSKNTISIAFKNKIILSPYIGNLSNINTFNFFTRTINTFKEFYDFNPKILIHDKHTQYESTKWAKKQNITLIEVQHHLAHIYSVKAEYCLSDDYTGFVFDGTGYGDDKTLWGGEVFIGDNRAYSFKTIKLLGSSKAIKEPRRISLSMLFEKYTLEEILNFDLDCIKSFKTNEIKLLYQTWEKDINCPKTSSVGRLFDAVASLKGICQYQSYEGEAGLLCENEYDYLCTDSFDFNINNNIIDISLDFFDKDIVSKFINTLVNIISKVAKKEKKEVILSGGVFQNKTLLQLVCKKLNSLNIKYYYNKKTPSNDSGISLGQMYYYIEKINK